MIRRRLKDEELTADIIKRASLLLPILRAKGLGASQEFTSGGKRFLAVAEEHFHPPGGPVKPWGKHIGVSAFALEAPDDVAPLPQNYRYHLGARSHSRLIGVHHGLALVVMRAIEITTVDFTVLEGVRTAARQAELVKSGASETLQSRHLTGHAVDIAPFVGGEVQWGWPLFHELAPAMFQAAREVGVTVEWGGNWKAPHRADGPHWQLPWGKYP